MFGVAAPAKVQYVAWPTCSGLLQSQARPLLVRPAKTPSAPPLVRYVESPDVSQVPAGGWTITAGSVY